MFGSLMSLFGGGNSAGMNTGVAGVSGTPDGVGPLPAGSNYGGLLGDFSNKQLEGMAGGGAGGGGDYATMGLNTPKAQAPSADSTSMGGLMALATANPQKPEPFKQMQGSPYVLGLMSRGL